MTDHPSPSPDVSPLERIRIVLVRPLHPGNIGAAARAMKTMGLSRLVLVQPHRFPHRDADAMAVHADDVLAAARVVPTIGEALAGTGLAIAAVGHSYEMAHDMVDCRESAARAVAAAVAGDEIALVFGNESHGLSVDEALACGLLAHIPAAPDCVSLNVAQAVQVFAYELRQTAIGTSLPVGVPTQTAATHDDIEHLHVHLEQMMIAVGFFDPDNPKRLRPRLRRLVARARLEVEEVRILRGLINAVTKATLGR